MIEVINLLISSVMIGTSCIGVITIINKIGKLCKIIDENKVDGFKIGFDTLMLDFIDDTNKCVESISSITNNLTKISLIVYDIVTGNKYIKKDKDGKIIICNKSKLDTSYKNKIEELSSKVKKYKEELNKIKVKKEKNTDKMSDESDMEDKSSDDKSSDDNSTVVSDDSKSSAYSEVSTDSENKTENKNEFYLK